MTQFEIKSEIVPKVRMTQRSKFVDPRAQEYLVSKAAIQYELKNQMAYRNLDLFPDKTPLSAVMIFYRPKMHLCDLDNLIKSVLDAAQGVLFKDDRWVDLIIARRYVDSEHFATLAVEQISQV